MIFDENLKSAQKTVTAAASAGTVDSGAITKSDVFDFGPKGSINVPKGAKIIVDLGAAMKDDASYLKLAYGDELSSGNISSESYSPEVFLGSETSTAPAYTQKRYVFHLDAIREQAFRYVQIVIGNGLASATTLDAKLTLETPHNSGASI